MAQSLLPDKGSGISPIPHSTGSLIISIKITQNKTEQAIMKYLKYSGPNETSCYFRKKIFWETIFGTQKVSGYKLNG